MAHVTQPFPIIFVQTQNNANLLIKALSQFYTFIFWNINFWLVYFTEYASHYSDRIFCYFPDILFEPSTDTQRSIFCIQSIDTWYSLVSCAVTPFVYSIYTIHARYLHVWLIFHTLRIRYSADYCKKWFEYIIPFGHNERKLKHIAI